MSEGEKIKDWMELLKEMKSDYVYKCQDCGRWFMRPYLLFTTPRCRRCLAEQTFLDLDRSGCGRCGR